MTLFKNIFLVNDNSNKGEFPLDLTLVLAKANQAGLTIMDIIDGHQGLKTKFFHEILNNGLLELVLKERQKELHNFIAPLLEKKDKVTIKVFQGTPFLEIIREVIHNNHNLVIKAVCGKDGIKDVLSEYSRKDSSTVGLLGLGH